jgi:hypothetical protein
MMYIYCIEVIIKNEYFNLLYHDPWKYINYFTYFNYHKITIIS